MRPIDVARMLEKKAQGAIIYSDADRAVIKAAIAWLVNIKRISNSDGMKLVMDITNKTIPDANLNAMLIPYLNDLKAINQSLVTVVNKIETNRNAK